MSRGLSIHLSLCELAQHSALLSRNKGWGSGRRLLVCSAANENYEAGEGLRAACPSLPLVAAQHCRMPPRRRSLKRKLETPTFVRNS